jgi:hypothetical protein
MSIQVMQSDTKPGGVLLVVSTGDQHMGQHLCPEEALALASAIMTYVGAGALEALVDAMACMSRPPQPAPIGEGMPHPFQD